MFPCGCWFNIVESTASWVVIWTPLFNTLSQCVEYRGWRSSESHKPYAMKLLAMGLEQIKREDPVHYSVEETKFYGNLIINSLVAAGEHRITQIYPCICVPTFNFSTEFFSFRSAFMWRTSNTNIGMQFPTVDECCCCELKTGVLLIGALHVVRVQSFLKKCCTNM